MKNFIWIAFFALTSLTRLFSQDGGGDPPPDSLIHEEPNSVYEQSAMQIEIEAQTAIRFANSADVYLKWAAVPGVSNYTVMYTLGAGETAVWSMTQSNTNQIVLPNIPLNAELSWSVLVGNTLAPTYQSYRGSVSTKPQNEPIKVSVRLYNQLEGWFAKENNPQSFCQFLTASDVNQYEKLSFLQAYFFDNASFVKPTAAASSVISNWYPVGTATGTDGNNSCIPASVVGCNCKILSMGSNIATPNEKMENFKVHPRFERKLVAISPDGDIALADRFEAGAAKYISLKQNIGGVAPPDNEEQPAGPFQFLLPENPWVRLLESGGRCCQRLLSDGSCGKPVDRPGVLFP